MNFRPAAMRHYFLRAMPASLSCALNLSSGTTRDHLPPSKKRIKSFIVGKTCRMHAKPGIGPLERPEISYVKGLCCLMINQNGNKDCFDVHLNKTFKGLA